MLNSQLCGYSQEDFFVCRDTEDTVSLPITQRSKSPTDSQIWNADICYMDERQRPLPEQSISRYCCAANMLDKCCCCRAISTSPTPSPSVLLGASLLECMSKELEEPSVRIEPTVQSPGLLLKEDSPRQMPSPGAMKRSIVGNSPIRKRRKGIYPTLNPIFSSGTTTTLNELSLITCNVLNIWNQCVGCGSTENLDRAKLTRYLRIFRIAFRNLVRSGGMAMVERILCLLMTLTSTMLNWEASSNIGRIGMRLSGRQKALLLEFARNGSLSPVNIE